MFADKTRNILVFDKDQHEKLLRENITKSYRKSDEQSTDDETRELKDISTKLSIGDRVDTMA